MPLDPNEVVSLSSQAFETGEALRAALAANGPGGKTITRGEARKLLRLTATFLLALIVDLFD